MADTTSGFATILTEQSWYIGDYLSGMLLGAKITLFLQSTYYLMIGPSSRLSKAFFISFSALIVILQVIGDSTNQIEGLLMWINDRNVPGGPEAYLSAHYSSWLNVFGSATVVTANFLGDGLLFYRCYILLARNRFIILSPVVLLFISSTTLGVLTVVESALPNATLFSGLAQSFGIPWVASSVAFNVVVTSLICGRIFISYLELKRLGMTSRITSEQWAVAAILVESALPFTIFGVVYVVMNGIGSQLAVLFADIWGGVVGLAPQLIILRVAMGRAWTRDTISSGIGPMQFRVTVAASTTTRFLSENIEGQGKVEGKCHDQYPGDDAGETV